MSRESDTAAQMLLLGAKSSWLAVREATRGTAAGSGAAEGKRTACICFGMPTAKLHGSLDSAGLTPF